MLSILERHRIVVCCGAGGSGKTTMSAALGLLAAERGARAIVVTIDPARRLADALGLSHLHSTPERVKLAASGALFAMMLEQKPAWDRLIERHAPNPLLRDRILINRFYRRFSREFAGAHAYAAIDTLSELAESSDYDTVILDTPPIRHAVDFFRAPSRVLALLESPAVGSLDRRPARWIMRRIERAAGLLAFEEAIAFLSLLREMLPVFIARAKAMQALLSSDRLASVLVSTPDQRALEEGSRLLFDLDELSIRTVALLFNRTAPFSADAPPRDLVDELLSAGLTRDVAEWVVESFARQRERAAGERERIDRFFGARTSARRFLLPELAADIHDLAGLGALGRILASSS